VRAYPLGGAFTNSGRVLLFLTPLFFLLIGEGVDRLRRAADGGAPGMRTAARAAAGALAILLLFPFAAFAVRGVPVMREEVKPLLAHASESWRDGDVLYVYYNARPAFEYYRGRYGFDDRAYVIGACSRARPAGYLQDLARMQGRPRVWVLFVGGRSAGGYDERRLMLTYLDHVGRRLDDQVAIESSLYLYDLSRPFGRAGPFPLPVPTNPEADCRGPWGDVGAPAAAR
jgi:hypothetical protein